MTTEKGFSVMKKCNKYEELIERYLTGEILTGEKDDLEQHLVLCSGCASVYSDVSEMDEILRNIPEREVEISPFLKTRIMARIAEEKPVRVRAFALRPIYLVSAALCIFLLVGLYAYLSRPTVVRMVKLSPKEIERPADFYAPQFTAQNGNRVIREVKIYFYNPDARKVAITGDFNNWNPDGLPLRPTAEKGLWEIDLRFRSGVYSYNFIIDGMIIVPDPNSPNQAPDGYGGMNSVLFVGKGDTS
jgi:hypothetical protein